MSSTTIEWLAVALFFICSFGFTFLEAAWLNNKNLIPFGKAFSYSFATNTFGITIGFFVSFVIFAVLLMLAYDGSMEKIPAAGITVGVAVAFAAFFPLVLLALTKRLTLRIFKMYSVGSPWLYSALSAIAFILLVPAIPSVFIYLLA